jgi:hypothetical protein
VGRFSDDSVGYGIDPQRKITLQADDETAIDVLEALIQQCQLDDECTWQMRRGFIEVGTKQRLSVPAAQTTQLYDIADLMLEPPAFDSNDSVAVQILRRQGRPGWTRFAFTPEPGNESLRKQPLELAVAIVGEVVETIEPGHWDYGQPIEAPEGLVKRPVEGGPGDDAAGEPDNGAHGPAPDAPTAAPDQPLPRTQLPVATWASIRVWRKQLVVIAPDFIHRQIGGYPDPVRPSAGPNCHEPSP